MPRDKWCFWSHRWSKWGKLLQVEGERFSVLTPNDKPLPFTRFIQERTCETCGMVQRRKVET